MNSLLLLATATLATYRPAGAAYSIAGKTAYKAVVLKTWPKSAASHCAGSKLTATKYTSYKTAEAACLKAAKCAAVYNNGCKTSGALAYYLCTAAKLAKSTSGSCCYVRPKPPPPPPPPRVVSPSPPQVGNVVGKVPTPAGVGNQLSGTKVYLSQAQQMAAVLGFNFYSLMLFSNELPGFQELQQISFKYVAGQKCLFRIRGSSLYRTLAEAQRKCNTRTTCAAVMLETNRRYSVCAKNSKGGTWAQSSVKDKVWSKKATNALCNRKTCCNSANCAKALFNSLNGLQSNVPLGAKKCTCNLDCPAQSTLRKRGNSIIKDVTIRRCGQLCSSDPTCQAYEYSIPTVKSGPCTTFAKNRPTELDSVDSSGAACGVCSLFFELRAGEAGKDSKAVFGMPTKAVPKAADPAILSQRCLIKQPYCDTVTAENQMKANKHRNMSLAVRRWGEAYLVCDKGYLLKLRPTSAERAKMVSMKVAEEDVPPMIKCDTDADVRSASWKSVIKSARVDFSVSAAASEYQNVYADGIMHRCVDATPCSLGQQRVQDDRCADCPLGSASPKGSACVVCEAGTFSNTSGSKACLRCPPPGHNALGSSLAAGIGQGRALPELLTFEAPLSTASRKANPRSRERKLGTNQSAAAACQYRTDCPLDGESGLYPFDDDGNFPTLCVQEWSASGRSFDSPVYRAPHAIGAWIESGIACQEGWSGVLCQSCAPTFHRRGAECLPCPDSSEAKATNNRRLLTAGATGSAAIVYMIYSAHNNGLQDREKSGLTPLIKVTITFLQLMSFSSSFVDKWSESILLLFGIAETMSAPLESFASLDCLRPGEGSGDAFIRRAGYGLFAVPATLALALTVVFVLAVVGGGGARGRVRWFTDLAVVSTLVVLNFFYPQILKLCISVSHCTRPICIDAACKVEAEQGVSMLHADLSTKCSDRRLLDLRSLTVPVFVLYGLGLPVCLLVLLMYMHRGVEGDQIDVQSTFYLRFSFLFKGFRSGAYYYETVMMGRKFLLCVLAQTLSSQPTIVRTSCAQFFVVLALAINLYVDPYVPALRSVYMFDTCSLLLIFYTLGVGQIQTAISAKTAGLLSVSALALNLLFFVLLALALFTEAGAKAAKGKHKLLSAVKGRRSKSSGSSSSSVVTSSPSAAAVRNPTYRPVSANDDDEGLEA